MLQSLHAAGWSSQVARRAHNPKVAGSNPAPATKEGPAFTRAFVFATQPRTDAGPLRNTGTTLWRFGGFGVGVDINVPKRKNIVSQISSTTRLERTRRTSAWRLPTVGDLGEGDPTAPTHGRRSFTGAGYKRANARTREARVKNLLKALRGAPSRDRSKEFENTSTVAEEV